MTGAETIESFLIHYDLKTSFSAQGFTNDEILLFLNNAQDQFIKDKVFGENFQPPAFDDNQKRVVDVLPLVKRAYLGYSHISPNTLYGSSAYEANKSALLSGRALYTVEFEIQVTRTNPTITDKYVRCENIKVKDIGKFVASEVNRTHFIYPKLVEDVDHYYIICDYYTSSVTDARVTVILRPYPITATSFEFNGQYNVAYMSLDTSVHQEIVDMAVAAALQTSGDKRYQTKVNEDQLNTN
jgi:hypothetical protein